MVVKEDTVFIDLEEFLEIYFVEKWLLNVETRDHNLLFHKSVSTF